MFKKPGESRSKCERRAFMFLDLFCLKPFDYQTTGHNRFEDKWSSIQLLSELIHFMLITVGVIMSIYCFNKLSKRVRSQDWLSFCDRCHLTFYSLLFVCQMNVMTKGNNDTKYDSNSFKSFLISETSCWKIGRCCLRRYILFKKIITLMTKMCLFQEIWAECGVKRTKGSLARSALRCPSTPPCLVGLIM